MNRMGPLSIICDSDFDHAGLSIVNYIDPVTPLFDKTVEGLTQRLSVGGKLLSCRGPYRLASNIAVRQVQADMDQVMNEPPLCLAEPSSKSFTISLSSRSRDSSLASCPSLR